MFGLHSSEQRALLRALETWQEATQGQALLVGGDLHFACNSLIRRDGRVVLQQVITSALSNRPPPACLYYCLWRLCLLRWCFPCGRVARDYTVSHSRFVPEPNFAVIRADAESMGLSWTVEGATGARCNTRCV